MITSSNRDSPAASWPRVVDPYRRPVAAQRSDVMGMSPERTATIAATWEKISRWFEDTASAYDATLELLARDPNVEERVREALEVALAAFDRAGDIARANAYVWDDLASEVTLAHARMSVIWLEYQDELHSARGISSGVLSRKFSSRSAREVWLPMQAEMLAASELIREVGPFPEDQLTALLESPAQRLH